MRLRVAIILIFVLLCGAVKACAQGLTIRDVAFVAAAGGGGTGGGGTTGGGGGTPPSPTYWWEMEEAGTADRVDSVASVHLTSLAGGFGGTVSDTTGLSGNAVLYQTAGIAENAMLHRELSADFATDGSSITLSFWFWRNWTSDNFGSAQVYLDTYSAGDVFQSELYWQYFSTTQYYAGVLDDDSGTDSYTENTQAQTGDGWHLAVLVYNASLGKCQYSQDGAALATAADTVTFAPGPKGSLIIRWASSSMEARVDKLAIWMSYAFTDSDATWLYNGGSGRALGDF